MKSFILYAFTFAVLFMGTIGVHVSSPTRRKLFVFGDSYADTGNAERIGWDLARAVLYPYGSTFPHLPTGRFSNGRVLTDFFASFLGLESPIPYKYRNIWCPEALSYGMNFAVAGSGAFGTANKQRNLTSQIDAFEAQIEEGIFSACDVKSSVALVVVSGNDYTTFVASGGDESTIKDFIKRLIKQIVSDLKRIKDLGVGKVVITNQFPFGCAPSVTRSLDYKKCNEANKFTVNAHNTELQAAIDRFSGGNNHSDILILDLFTVFSSIVDRSFDKRIPNEFKHTLKPCCDGKTKGTLCGQFDDHGSELYTLCSDVENYFFWDNLHPTQAGWTTVFEQLKPSLNKFLG